MVTHAQTSAAIASKSFSTEIATKNAAKWLFVDMIASTIAQQAALHAWKSAILGALIQNAPASVENPARMVDENNATTENYEPLTKVLNTQKFCNNIHTIQWK